MERSYKLAGKYMVTAYEVDTVERFNDWINMVRIMACLTRVGFDYVEASDFSDDGIDFIPLEKISSDTLGPLNDKNQQHFVVKVRETGIHYKVAFQFGI